MPDIVAGSPVYGNDFPPSGFDSDWTVQANISSTSYASGTPAVAVNVTAPTSGRVLVCVGGGIRNNAANTDRGIITYRVLEDDSNGPVFTAESAYRGIASHGINSATGQFKYAGGFSLEQGLTPGRNYYFQVRHRVTAGSGTVDISSRDITVIPVP